LSEVAGLTVRDSLVSGSARLADAGCETPRLDAELLLAAALAVGREQLVLDASEPVDDDVGRRFEAFVARRAAREPVAYIVGHREFRRISLAVDRRALIPRPETELLVEVGLELEPAARVVDVGCGSGAVALALKDERPDLSVVGIDLSPGAVALARSNAARLGLEVEFVCGDLLGERRFDVVLANLPYVASGAALAPEISLYEPAEALYAGPDGLDVIRRLVAALGAEGADISLVALEVGFDQSDAVASLLGGAGFGSVSRLRDLAGIERVIVGRR
jgi:release factor glutamine methyltransferase